MRTLLALHLSVWAPSRPPPVPFEYTRYRQFGVTEKVSQLGFPSGL
jgi:hypothetical protein